LHEHDQEAGDQSPHKIDGNFVLADLIDDITDGRALFGVRYGNVAGSTG